MEEQLITFDIAKLAKEKGFNVNCLQFYTKPNSRMFGLDEHGRSYAIRNSIKNKIYTIGSETTLHEKNVIFAPTQSLLQKWLREKCEIVVELTATTKNKFSCAIIKGKKVIYLYEKNKIYPYEYKTYEAALDRGLEEALKLIK